MRLAVVMLCALILGSGGCASTTVKRHPGPHDRGIRYYRPKPYLLVQPAPVKDGAPSKDMVSITLDYLPDFSEEYSIHVRSGIGSNSTQVTLDKGWNLTQINTLVDSQTDENLNALGNLIGKFTPTGGGTQARPEFTVKANNVPLGYYESIISQGPCGEKRLYGWRYVGFAPFNSCPTDSGGLQCTDCQTADVYALVVVDGTMTFRRLQEVAATPLLTEKADRPANTIAQTELDTAMANLGTQPILLIREALGDPGLEQKDVRAKPGDGNSAVITITVGAGTFASIADLPAKQKEILQTLGPVLKSSVALRDLSFSVVILQGM